MLSKLSFWIILSVANLTIVAALGLLMRYKIGFEFPFFDQKFIQHAHSHFAFSAWISQTLYVLLVYFTCSVNDKINIRFYRNIFIANTVSAYGMLISFMIQGYGAFSIGFSQASVIVFYVFAYRLLKDLRSSDKTHPSLPWIKSALFFNLISGAGTYTLAYMMSTHNVSQNLYLASVYYYLHFQYNGWFLFAGIGLFIARIKSINPEFKLSNLIFRGLAWSCIPAYLLSTLWLDLPDALYILVVCAAIIQFAAWIGLFRHLYTSTKQFLFMLPAFQRFLFLLSAVSLSIKFILQLASCIPYVSQLAFGFRPIIIAYLHLVLLAVFTLFILTFISAFIQKHTTRFNRFALLFLAAGIYMNELILGIQGIASFSYTLIPYVNESLFFVSLLMFAALILLLSGFFKISFADFLHKDRQ